MRPPISTHGRRPAINALVTAGDGPSISGQIVLLAPFGPRATHIVQLGTIVVEQRLG